MGTPLHPSRSTSQLSTFPPTISTTLSFSQFSCFLVFLPLVSLRYFFLHSSFFLQLCIPASLHPSHDLLPPSFHSSFSLPFMTLCLYAFLSRALTLQLPAA